MKKLNVILIGAFPDDVTHIKGGVQASVYGLAKALSQHDEILHVKIIAVPQNHDPALQDTNTGGLDVTYLRTPLTFLASNIFHLPRVMNDIKKYHDPLIHVHGVGLLQTILILRYQCVWTLHGLAAKENYDRLLDRPTASNALRLAFYWMMEHLCIRFAELILVNTPYVRDALPAWRTKIDIIPQGLFTQEITGTPPQPFSIEPLILSVGVMDRRKGHHLTIEAFAEARRKLPNARLAIACSITDTNYFKQIQQQIKDLNLEQSVTLYVDLPRSGIIDLFARSSLFVLHSREETQCIALCEALVAGLPIVATRIGGIPFVVTDGQDGRLTPYGDVHAFAAAIVQLLTDETLRAHMSERARQSGSKYDWAEIISYVVKSYKCLTN